ncbi:MFS transporter, partial [Acetobacter okinawensis]|nr:MFS transporter [Acetobacter okinawensis]
LCGGVVLGASGAYAVLAWSAGLAMLALGVLWAGRFVARPARQTR